MNKKMLIVLLGFLVVGSLSFAEQRRMVVPANSKIILERSRCFGLCPAYKLTIYADGKIEFIGDKFVNAKGPHAKTIPQKNVEFMFTEVYNANFFGLDGRYDCFEGVDNPTVKIAVTKGERTKEIVHYHGCESADQQELAALTILEDKIDELAEIADWKKFGKER
ncbi:MAG: hypothetical protein HQL21_05735 [Candidatus Omnitrophica bacterium]|nr:hypothetical protein [Candidatus Omnitrophota bacterium]